MDLPFPSWKYDEFFYPPKTLPTSTFPASRFPNDGYFPPDQLVTGLSTLIQLKRLTVGLHSPPSRPPPSLTRPPPQPTTLPSHTFLDFYGAREYLEFESTCLLSAKSQ